MRTRAIVLAVIVVACVGAILLFRAHRSTNRIVCDSFGMGEPTTQCFITEHEPFKVQANHNPAKDTTGYRFYVNEKMVSEVPATAAANGVVMFSSEGLSAGTYMLYIEAYGPGGSSRSGLKLDVKPKEK